MGYNYIEDVEGIEDLTDLGGTASLGTSAFGGIVIRATDDGDGVYVQDVGSSRGKIELYDIEYFQGDDEILDILNMTEDEFEDYCGGSIPGFKMGDTIYLISEFIRDDF